MRLRFLFLAGLLAASPAGPSRVRRWRADLTAFARRYESEQPAPFARIPREEFERRVGALEAALPELDDAQVATRWSALIGALGEPHTAVDFDDVWRQARLPIELEAYDDGFYVVAAARPFEALVGSRLARVEGVPIETLYAALKTYVPYSQEGWYRMVFAESLPDWPLLLDAAGLVERRSAWSLQVEAADGATHAQELPLMGPAAWKRLRWSSERLPERLMDQQPRRAYFCRVLARRTLYLRFRSCRDMAGRPFGPFLRRAMDLFRSQRLLRVVVDLRGNRGGQDELAEALKDALRRAKPQEVAALIDGQVFSAGAVAAWRLRHEAGARLYGETCGAGANHAGAVHNFRLPSGREAELATELHLIDAAHPGDFSSPIAPDRELRATHADRLAGRDPALEAAIETLP